MFTAPQFNSLKKSIAAYWATLDIKDVRGEYAKKGLLTQNKKLEKGDNLNLGLELLPSVLAPNLNLCKGAGACKYSCLAFSGQGNVMQGPKLNEFGILPAPIKAKARRTFLFANDPMAFHMLLDLEIEKAVAVAKLEGVEARFRLNTTSDVDWTDVAKRHPDVNFYDYCKVFTRESLPNYHITYSFSEKVSLKKAIEKLSQGQNVAVVFDGSGSLPETWYGFPVINGDENDDRYNDPKGVVVGLKLKTTIGGGDKDSVFAKAKDITKE